MTCQMRTVWLSDIHLGTAAARADDLLRFLDAVSCERLYLAGDIVDLERMRGKAGFPPRHWELARRFMALANNGVEVIYIPGNHDFQVRDLAGTTVAGIDIALEAEHTTLAGDKLLVVHGDCLDGQTRQGTNLEQFGAAAYGWLVEADARINRLRSRLGHDYAPIASRIKRRLKAANAYIARFERTAAGYAALRGADGIVCGHIHRPALRMIDSIRYANDGDWVEHRTAIGEDFEGQLRLLRWHRGKPLILEYDDERALAA